MRPLLLRRASTSGNPARQALGRWRRAGVEATWATADPTADYLYFHARRADGGWHGRVDARQWLRHTLSQLPDLLPASLHPEAAAQLFAALEHPLQLPAGSLVYDRLELKPPLARHPAQAPWVALPWGGVWLESAAPAALPAASAWLYDIPLQLQLVLGRTPLLKAEACALAAGDLLALQTLCCETWLGSRRLGTFTLADRGFCMSDAFISEPDALESVSAESAPGEPAFDGLMVSVEFVVHSRSMSLAQLAALDPGEVLELPADAQRSVRLRIADRDVAIGELVQLEGCLGIELLSVTGGPP